MFGHYYLCFFKNSVGVLKFTLVVIRKLHVNHKINHSLKVIWWSKCEGSFLNASFKLWRCRARTGQFSGHRRELGVRVDYLFTDGWIDFDDWWGNHLLHRYDLLLHSSCSSSSLFFLFFFAFIRNVYRIWNNGHILTFKVYKWPYLSFQHDRIICK